VKRQLLFALLSVVVSPAWGFCQNTGQFYRIVAETPSGLQKLFRFDGHTMPLVSAHRGGTLPGYPENCIATFENTLRHTFSLLEIDLQYTRDGQIVLHHDASLERTTNGTGRVVDHTLRELKELRLKDRECHITEYHMPTLDEALQWARGKTIVILDKKNVPVKACVAKIEEYRAETYAMVMAYSFQDIKTCHELNRDIMMEVMIGNEQRFRGYGETNVPWNHVIAFVGHKPPQDKPLLDKLHAKGVCCLAGTSRNLDRQLRLAKSAELSHLRREYQTRLQFGVDLIETDLPIQLGSLLFAPPGIPESKRQYFHLP